MELTVGAWNNIATRDICHLDACPGKAATAVTQTPPSGVFESGRSQSVAHTARLPATCLLTTLYVVAIVTEIECFWWIFFLRFFDQTIYSVIALLPLETFFEQNYILVDVDQTSSFDFVSSERD